MPMRVLVRFHQPDGRILETQMEMPWAGIRVVPKLSPLAAQKPTPQLLPKPNHPGTKTPQ
jgi:hypothetical protein